MTTTEIFKCYKKKSCFVANKNTHQQHAFDAQNAGNRISELLDFKFFWRGGMPL